MSELIKVTIPRSRWDRGPRATSAYLVREVDSDGNICGCVLGHIGVALGVPVETMRGEAYPMPHEKWPATFFTDDDGYEADFMKDTLSAGIAALNDTSFDSDTDREACLRAELEHHNIQLEFVD